MKRILFIIACVITLGLATLQANETNGQANDGPACVTVGNVSASITEGTNNVHFTNYNDYKVTVTWTVYGHRKNGSKSEVGSGVVVLGVSPNCNATEKYSKSDDYTSYSVKITAQKCD